MLLLMLCGCGKRAYFVLPGTTTINQKWIKGATLAVPDKDGNMVPGVKADIPPGALIQVEQ